MDCGFGLLGKIQERLQRYLRPVIQCGRVPQALCGGAKEVTLGTPAHERLTGCEFRKGPTCCKHMEMW